MSPAVTLPASTGASIMIRGQRALTNRQTLVLEKICEHIRTYGRPPTLRWIGGQLGIRSTNGVNDHLRALERKGFIRRDDGVSCGIVVLVGPPAMDPEGASPAPFDSLDLNALTFDVLLLAWRVAVEKHTALTYQLRQQLVRLADKSTRFRRMTGGK